MKGLFQHPVRGGYFRFAVSFAFSVFISLSLVACGGGGGGSSSASAPAVPAGSGAVSGQVQASYINGVRVCVDETVGTASGNCATTSNQGNFTLQNAVGKKLSVLIDTVPIGTISADQVTGSLTITPTSMADGDATKAQKITAIFHQTGTNTGLGSNMICDLKNVKSADINKDDLKAYLADTKNTLTIGAVAIDHTKEQVASAVTRKVNGTIGDPTPLLNTNPKVMATDANGNLFVATARSKDMYATKFDKAGNTAWESMLLATPDRDDCRHIVSMGSYVYALCVDDDPAATLGNTNISFNTGVIWLEKLDATTGAKIAETKIANYGTATGFLADPASNTLYVCWMAANGISTIIRFDTNSNILATAQDF